jgi:hypothetical protein
MVTSTRSRLSALARLALVVAVFLLAFPLRAHADKVTDLIGQLKNGEDKIRLSAALSLSKLGDQRAVQPLIDALKDSDRNVRGAAANGLGKIVTEKTDATKRADAAKALAAAAKSDSSSIVKKNAKQAADIIGKLGSGSGSTSVPKGGVYVDIGPMDAKGTGADAKLKAAMRATTEKTISKSAKSMVTAWPGGKAPKQSELDKTGVQAFHVDGNVTEVKSSGGMVSCKISMLIASYPDKAMFGFLKGGASVEGGNNEETDKIDCVSAVVEDMVMKKIIPTIKTKAGI